MKKIYSILLRYAILVAVAIPNLYLFYLIFTPLTIYPVYFLLNLFFNVSLVGNQLFLNSCSTPFIEIIPACIAGSAYYLLTILNLSTPNIKNRILPLASSFLFLLILNILRIFFLSILHINNSNLFALSHKIFWYFGSTLFVILIWFLHVKLFKIKNIPIYSDINYIYRQTKK